MTGKQLTKIPDDLQEKIDQLGLRVGDYCIYKYGGYIQIVGFHIWENDKGTYRTLYVDYSYYEDEERGKSSSEFKYFQDETYLKINGTPEQIETQALAAFNNPETLASDEEVSDSTALVVSGGMAQILQTKATVEAKEHQMKVFERALAQRMDHIRAITRKMTEQLKKLYRVVAVLELYLGVNQEVIQIQEGQPAPADTPISIRQLVLYMDEEVGDPTDGGIDFTRIEDFDNWITTGDNYKKVIPESKGIVAMRPSRQSRWQQTIFGPLFAVREGDLRCYLLIRNGENLYRIYTNMNIGTHFFPTEGEIKTILETLDKQGWDKSKAEESHLNFARNALLFQGLVDRTEVFYPLAGVVNIQDSASPFIRYIYDGELHLPDGRLTYEEWKAKINAEIRVGSRVFIAPIEWNDIPSEYRHYRFTLPYSKGGAPANPDSGIYTVEDERVADWYTSKDKAFVIRYNPGGEVGGSWYSDWHERKNRVGFMIFPDRDKFVLNYDLLSLDDIEWYLESRIDRKNYLSMIPALWGIRKERLAELEWERHFVELVTQRQGVDPVRVWESIEWWKRKVKWTRPIREDDAKALRMIEARINRQVLEK